ncbi:MAG TPA: hypothetical protein VGF87_04785 [Acidimicrobiales bacterium]|jgi:hypothetical protein
MSDQSELGVLSLEDLFLSREFGQPRAFAPAATDTLFGNGSSRGPLVPLTAGAGSVAGHLTTTHLRRNRSLFAAVSGAAAALLVAVGVLAQTHSPTKPTGEAIGSGGKGSVTPVTIPHGFPLPTTTATTGTVVTPASGGTVGLADFGNGSSGSTTLVHTTHPLPVTLPSITQPGNQVGVVPGTPSTPAPASTSGNVLTPVVTLVGHAVTTVGATASTASLGLGVTLPVITPVTGVVGSLGGTLSNLGDSLSGTAV